MDLIVKADAPHVVLPDREKMKTQMESLIYHFKIVTEGFAVPAGEVYQAIESPRGEDGLLRGQRRDIQAVSRAYAQPFVSATPLQALQTMCHGRLLADVVAVVGSIDIVLGEIDR